MESKGSSPHSQDPPRLPIMSQIDPVDAPFSLLEDPF
jgi:hypothetical protein